MSRKRLLIIALSATILAVFWQELNLHYLNNNYPASNGLITCADEASYLRPPQNLLEIGTWKTNDTGITSHFMRPPGFGIYFISLKLVFGKYVWLAMKIAQILFFFLSILLFSKILKLLGASEKINTIFTSIYAFFPCYSGFMYFTVTESISPFFLLLSVYYWLKICKNQNEKALKFILSSGFLILIRPQLLIFVAFFICYLFIKAKKKTALFALLAFLPFLLWNLRSISYSGEYLGIHPIYHKTNNSLYRPSHEKMTDLFRIWEYQGDVFHTAVGILAKDTSSCSIEKALNLVPANYRPKVKAIFQSYHELRLYHSEHFKGEAKISSYYKGELEFGRKIDALTKKLKNEHKFDYYIKTPFNSFKKLVISSHLNLAIHQDYFRGMWWMEILRWVCLLLLVGTYCLSFLSIFRLKISAITVLAWGIGLSFFYLSYVQRMNEERYLTPILALTLLISARFFSKIKSDETN